MEDKSLQLRNQHFMGSKNPVPDSVAKHNTTSDGPKFSKDKPHTMKSFSLLFCFSFFLILWSFESFDLGDQWILNTNEI